MGIFSNSDRGERCAATEPLFDITDAEGGLSDGDAELSAEPDGDILPDTEGTC